MDNNYFMKLNYKLLNLESILVMKKWIFLTQKIMNIMLFNYNLEQITNMTMAQSERKRERFRCDG